MYPFHFWELCLLKRDKTLRCAIYTIRMTYICEALLGVIGIRDIWVKNYRDTGYLGGKLKGYGIFLKRFWDIEVIIF